MRRLNYFLFAMLPMFFMSCSSRDNPGTDTENYGIYKIVLEAAGENYSAKAHIYNTNNVNLYDDTAGQNLGSYSILQTFQGKQVYSTINEVSDIVVQGLITSRNPATLKMTVYKNSISIYEKTVSLDKNGGGNDGTVDIIYSSLTE